MRAWMHVCVMRRTRVNIAGYNKMINTRTLTPKVVDCIDSTV